MRWRRCRRFAIWVVVIEGPHNGHVTIYGVGLHGLKQPAGPLYLGNAGTAMRLMAGLMAAQGFDVELTGDESLSKRPMDVWLILCGIWVRRLRLRRKGVRR